MTTLHQMKNLETHLCEVPTHEIPSSCQYKTCHYCPRPATHFTDRLNDPQIYSYTNGVTVYDNPALMCCGHYHSMEHPSSVCELVEPEAVE